MPTVSSYSPELLELLRKAAVEPVEIGPLTEKAAFRLRFRLYSLRKQMRKEAHPDTPLADRVTVKLRYPAQDSVIVLCTPEGDADLIQAIRDAGIDLTEQDPPMRTPNEPEAVPNVRRLSHVEEILSGFTSSRKEPNQ